MSVRKKTTCTKLVVDYLTALDDFATREMILHGAGIKRDQITITLHDLKRRHAINAMEVDGCLWFYATPDEDNRMRTIDEIKDGITRKRQSRKPKIVLVIPEPLAS